MRTSLPATCFIGGLLGIMMFQSAVPAQPLLAKKKPPVPSSTKLAEVQKQIKEVFAADYARRTRAARLALAKKLLKEGEATKDNLPARYVLLLEARNAALQGGDTKLAFQAVKLLQQSFDVSGAMLRVEILEKISPRMVTPTAASELLDQALANLDEALAFDDLDAAARLIKIAQTAARRTRMRASISLVQLRSQEVQGLRKVFAEVMKAYQVLEKKDGDPDANTTVGKYLCLYKGEWRKELAYLLLAGDAKLKGLADKELGLAFQKKPENLVAIADGWYEVGNTMTGLPKDHAQAHAFHLYRRALPALEGTTKDRVAKQVKALAEAAFRRSNPRQLLGAIREAVQGKQFQASAIMGGIFDQAVQSIPEEGMILTGFEVGLGDFFTNKFIAYVRPIYLSAQGKEYGKEFGKRPRIVKTITARKGYAVSGLTVKSGLLLDGFAVHFMRIGSNGLIDSGAYKSEWVGGKGGANEKVLGNDGLPVVGLGIKRNKDGTVTGLGIVQAGIE